MKAILAKSGSEAKDPEAFQLIEQHMPQHGKLDLLVRVISISMNPVDTKVRKRFENDAVLGWDAYGVVEKVGEEVSAFTMGDTVYYAGDLTRPGCNSEYHVVDHPIAVLAPEKFSAEDVVAMLVQWLLDAMISEVKQLWAIASTLKDHFQRAIQYYPHRITNGLFEGLNNKIRTMKRQTYGFRNMGYFTLRLYDLHSDRYAFRR